MEEGTEKADTRPNTKSTRAEVLVGGSSTKYRLIKKIGSGSFGDVYLAVNVLSAEEVAVKMESQKTKHP